jgi:glycosyltransferase involved in cell wall biosynthesis
MKIIHFLLGRCSPDSANGVDKTIYYLSKAQSRLGHKVFVFSMSPKNSLPIGGVDVRTFAIHQNPFRLPDQLLNVIDEVSPNVVHLHSVFIPQNISLAKWLRSKNIPYVVTPHGGLVPQALKRKRWFKSAFKVFLEYSYWNNVAFIHAVGELEAAYIKQCGIRRPIIIAPNAIDSHDIPDPYSLNNHYLSKLYPHIKGKRILLFLGRLDVELKGLDLLIMALSRVKNNLKNVVLILIGPDQRNGQAFLEKLARKLGVSHQVFFAGPKYGMEKFEAIMSAHIFVHTSRNEAAPFSILEAFAMGKPCLITEPVGFKDFFHKYEVGWRVKPAIEYIAEGLKYLTLVPNSELERMAGGIRSAVFKEFSWEKTAKTICESY